MPLRVDVLLPNSSQYSVLHYFTESLFQAFKRLGYCARLLDKDQYTTALFADRPSFSIGFNGAPADAQKEFLCDQTQVPHIACLVDPPYRFMSLLTSPYIMVACDDKYWVDLLQKEGHTQLYFMPHAVEPGLIVQTSTPVYDAVFLGTFIDPEQCLAAWEERHPRAVRMAMQEAVEKAFSSTPLYFAQAFLDAVQQKYAQGILPPFDLAAAFQDLELYIKARERLALIQGIHSCRIDVFGGSTSQRGWQDILSQQANVKVHPAIEYKQALHIMQQAKIVLNCGMKSAYGAHERIFSGLALGAAVVTNSNSFIQDHFQDQHSILLYQLHQLDSLNEKIGRYTADEHARQELVQRGRDVVLKFHTWDARLSSLLPKVLPTICALNS